MQDFGTHIPNIFFFKIQNRDLCFLFNSKETRVSSDVRRSKAAVRVLGVGIAAEIAVPHTQFSH